MQDLTNPTDKRIFAVAAALYQSDAYSIEKLASLTRIDSWFLSKMNNIIAMVKTLESTDYKVLKFVYSKAVLLSVQLHYSVLV